MKRKAAKRWSKEDIEWLKKNYTTHTNLYCAKHLPGGPRTVGSVDHKASRLGLTKGYNEPDFGTDVITAIKQRGWTEKEIMGKFGYEYDEVVKMAKKVEGFTLFEQLNEFHQPVLILLAYPEEEPEILPKAYDFSLQPEGQPYMFINIHGLGRHDKIKIMPLSDVHLGHKKTDLRTFKQDIQYIANNDNVFTFINGDLIENASKLSVAGGVYEQEEMPGAQIRAAFELLAPIAHKILWSISGNHEDRAQNHMGIDLGRIIADKLKVPYFNEPVYVDLMWAGNKWTIFDQHGASCAQTKGGKINAASKPLTWTEYTHFVIMGHVHDKMENEVTRIVRDPVNFRLQLRKQYVIILSSYLGYFGTYGARKGYAPPSTGRSTMKMYRNGKHYTGN